MSLKVNLHVTVITLFFVSEALIKTWFENKVYSVCTQKPLKMFPKQPFLSKS